MTHTRAPAHTHAHAVRPAPAHMPTRLPGPLPRPLFPTNPLDIPFIFTIIDVRLARHNSYPNACRSR
jgi:hypothetical protein